MNGAAGKLRRAASASVIALASCIAGGAYAQEYPLKTVRMLVTLPAGSSSDIVARVLGENLSKSLGQQFIVDNRPGAAGNIAAAIAAKASADGYTLFISTISTHGTNPWLYSQLGFEPVKDFVPIVLLASNPNVLVVLPSTPVRSVKELIALAKARPGEVTYASGGAGTSQHMAGEFFNVLAGVKLAHVPYKGTPQGLAGVLSGEVLMMFPSVPVAIGHVKPGKLRGLGVTSAKRLAWWKEMPTIAEAGLPGFDVSAWFGLSAPARTPESIITKVNTEANKVLQIPAVRDKLNDQGLEVHGGTPQEYARFIEAELARWGKVVKTAGIKIE
jgi:tripartite-type tricarboxylate transporter receptor subunit TctC